MNNEPLKYAQCCGNCVYCNRPKRPEDHAPHYETAKTQRWCYFHKFRTTREAVCDNFEQEQKKGGIPAIKRVLKFHQRAQRIKDIAKKLGEQKIYLKNTITVSQKDGWLYYEYKWGGFYHFEDNVGHMDHYLDELEKQLNQ